MRSSVHGPGHTEVRATAQEVQRSGTLVRVVLVPPPGPPAGHWRLALAEPVLVAAGEQVIVETGWPLVDQASLPCHPLTLLTMTEDVTVTAVIG
jgi:hypothetical protein